MATEIYELDFGGGGLVRMSNEGKTDLKVGQILLWGGNMGYPAERLVIAEEHNEFGFYPCVSFKDKRQHNVESYRLKFLDEETRHKQYHFILDEFMDEEEARAMLKEAKFCRERELKEEEERQQKRAEWNKKPLEVGDTFQTSWGYEQTNYDFIVVKSISPTGKTAMCQRAKLAVNESRGAHWRQLPSAEGYGDEFRMKVLSNQGLRGTYIFCGDGENAGTRLGGFSRVTPFDKGYYETDSMFGH